MKQGKERIDTASFVIITAALTFMLVTTSLMNMVVFPQFDSVFTYARDISVTAGAISLLGVGALARFAPHTIKVRASFWFMLACLVLGSLLMLVGLAQQLPFTTTIGASLVSIGRTGSLVVVALAASKYSLRAASVMVVSAFFLSCLAKAIFWYTPIWLGIFVFLALPILGIIMVWDQAEPLLRATAESEAPVDIEVTNPSSFLPLAGQFFLCLFLFRIAFGFSLRFGEVAGVPVSDFLIIIPVALMALHVYFSKRTVPSDLLMSISLLTIVAGFLFVTADSVDLYTASNVLISAGNTMFDLVAWTVLLAIAHRNPLGALTTFAWGRGVSSAGSLVGAALGVWCNHLFANDRMMLVLVVGSFIVLFVGYALIGLKKFSFAETIEGVVPVSNESIPNPDQEFEVCCKNLAQEFGLTPRELEVFMMLARGRDRAYIQEQLTVSRNTVKAHVKHVYVKLDIHSHQDLIELVDCRRKAQNATS